MKRTPETIGAEGRRNAALALEDLSARQQRAAVSNLQRAIMLKMDDPATHQRALASLRQSIGHRVPGWQEMLLAVSLLTGDSIDKLEAAEAGKSGRAGVFIDGQRITSEELELIRLSRQSSWRRRCYVFAYLQEGQTEEGKAHDGEVERRVIEAEEQRRQGRTPPPPPARSFRVIEGGADA